MGQQFKATFGCLCHWHLCTHWWAHCPGATAHQLEAFLLLMINIKVFGESDIRLYSIWLCPLFPDEAKNFFKVPFFVNKSIVSVIPFWDLYIRTSYGKYIHIYTYDMVNPCNLIFIFLSFCLFVCLGFRYISFSASVKNYKTKDRTYQYLHLCISTWHNNNKYVYNNKIISKM